MKRLIFITLLLAPIGNAMAGNTDLVKNQVIESIDATRTLGSALEHRQRCTSFKWDEGTDVDGRDVVTYTCQMKSAESDALWKNGLVSLSHDMAGPLEGYQRKIQNPNTFMPCREHAKGDDDVCRGYLNSYQKLINTTQASMEKAKRLQTVSINDVTQTITWAVVSSVKSPVTLLSAKYYFKMDDGEAYNAGQREEVMYDIYSNTNGNNPAKGLAKYVLFQTPTKTIATSQPAPQQEPIGDNDLTCQLEDKTQMTLSHSDTTVYIAFSSPGDDSDEGGQVIKLDIPSGGAQQLLGSEGVTGGKYFVLRGTDEDIEGAVSINYSLTNEKKSASYSKMTSLGKESENLACLPDTIKVADGLLKSGLSHVGSLK